MTKSAATRVLICEDSRGYAAALKRFLEYDRDIAVVGVRASAEEAIAALTELEPSVITMDIELRGMSGLEGIEQIMSMRPLPMLLLSSHVNERPQLTAAALAAGALEAVDKGDLNLREPTSPEAVAFRRRLKLLGRAHVIRHPRARLNGRHALASAARKASVIGVCASTGGPQLLALLFDALPADYPIPLLVVQHITAGFTDGLATWLDRAVALPVRVAEEGVKADRGVWIAPEGAHLRLERSGRLGLDWTTVAGLHRPSGDVLFESIAANAGRSGVAVILSGMGRDGAAGAAAVKRHGGLAIAQDERSSAVYGMPRAAVEQGVDLSLAPAQIAERLRMLRHEALEDSP